jgi:hypothetical protein
LQQIKLQKKHKKPAIQTPPKGQLKPYINNDLAASNRTPKGPILQQINLQKKHKKPAIQTPPKGQLKPYINNDLAAINRINRQIEPQSANQKHPSAYQQRISAGRFHKEQSPRFSSFFGNFPFPTTLARISHKFFFNSCSSELGCPACLISFQVHRILYTTEPKASLQRIALRDLLHQSFKPKVKISFHIIGAFPTLPLDIQNFQSL